MSMAAAPARHGRADDDQRQLNLAHLRTWIGKSESRVERIAPFPANALAATLNRDDPEYAEGTPLPPLWHWLHFLPVFRLADSGYDGHAAPGGFLPPAPLPRRLWAGGRLRFHAPLLIGRRLKKISTIKSIRAKTGRSGRLLFVTVGHQVFDGQTLGLDEAHDIVYLAPSSPAPAPPPAPGKWQFARAIKPDPVLLFRYSALTFNGHRIHYDQPFCVDSEGYPGLIVQAPLLATLLLDLLRRERPGAVLRSFEFRALCPLFANDACSLHGMPEANGKTCRLWARRPDGALAIWASTTLA